MRQPFNQRKYQQLLDKLDRLKSAASDSPFILFGMPQLSHNYLKFLYYLKKTGAVIVVMVADDRLHGAMDLEKFVDGRFFDYIHVSNPFDIEMPMLVAESVFDLVHIVVGSGPPDAVSQMIRTKKSPVIIEYRDFREIMFEDPDKAKFYLNVEDMDREAWDWQTIYTGCDGLIYKDSPEIIAHLNRKHQSQPAALQFMSYVAGDYVCNGRHLGCNDIPQIVYAGCVHNSPKSHAYPVYATFFDVIGKLVSKNIRFTIVNAMDTDGLGYEAYLELANRNSNFNYVFAKAQDRLADFLAAFDLGILYFDYSRAVESEFFHRTTFGSKLFNYLEAGLPVIVSSQTQYMAEMVEQHGIGLVIRDNQDLDKLGSLIRNIDWPGMEKQISAYRDEYCMEKQLPRLLEFYNLISKRQLFITGSKRKLTGVAEI
jgi:glycosyltransferase involved in cell wall biosynthesis